MSAERIIKLSDTEETLILDKLRLYILEEFDVDIGNLPARFLLDFIIESLGPHIYNQVVEDMEPWLYERFTVILEDMHSFKKY